MTDLGEARVGTVKQTLPPQERSRHAYRTATPVEPVGGPRLRSTPGYPPLVLSSWLWHLTRWGGLFCCSYLVSNLTDAPFLTQLVGVMIFAPMLLGGFAFGVMSDRLDRRQVVRTTQFALMPVMFGMFAVIATHNLRFWMAYPFMFAIGVGGVVNMTCQRALIVDVAGPRLAARALTLEAVLLASAGMTGPLVGGVVIGVLGLAPAFGLLAVTLCLSAFALSRVPSGAARDPATSGGVAPPATSMGDQARVSLRLLRRSPELASMLGATMVLNFFYFSFVPLVPVLARRFDAGPTVTGLLAAMAGCGSLVTGVVLASRRVEHVGRVYIGGCAVALTSLGLFAFAPVAGLAFVALFLAGTGAAGFSSTQSLLAISSVPEGERGAALGLLSMAIGCLPLGMLLLGVVAELLGPRMALVASSAAGLTALAVWVSGHPAVLGEMSPGVGPRATA